MRCKSNMAWKAKTSLICPSEWSKWSSPAQQLNVTNRSKSPHHITQQDLSWFSNVFELTDINFLVRFFMGISKLHWWLLGGIMWVTPTCEDRQFNIVNLKQSHQCFGSLHQDLIGFLSQDSQGGVSKLSWFGLSGFYEFITLCSDLWLGWGWKQTYSSP